MTLASSDYQRPNLSNVPLCPNIWLAPHGRVPSAIAMEAEGSEAFNEDKPNLWCKDQVTGMILPYWAPEEVVEAIRTSVFNLALQCSPAAVDWLRERRLIMLPPDLRENQNERQHTEKLQKDNYAVLREIFPKPVMDMLMKRMRLLQSQRKLGVCRQVLERTRISDDPFMVYFHLQLAKYLNKIMIEKIKASYVYSVIYHEGAILKRHTDRPQCRWNLSVVHGATPDITMENTWPIYLEIDEKKIEVKLLPGDGVLYSGTDIPHWRDQQPPGMETIVSFFHFVAHDFSQTLK